MPTEGTSLSDMAARTLDLIIALPLAFVTFLICLPVLAIGTGVGRGLVEAKAYAEGERGRRLLGPACDTKADRLRSELQHVQAERDQYRDRLQLRGID